MRDKRIALRKLLEMNPLIRTGTMGMKLLAPSTAIPTGSDNAFCAKWARSRHLVREFVFGIRKVD
jgi:hypothetical protein